jgi:Ras GTPase-activating-like protein IQGAP2/3
LRSVALDTLFDARFAIVPIASQYIKASLTDYVQLALEKNIMRIVQAPELDLCTDPVEVS